MSSRKGKGKIVRLPKRAESKGSGKRVAKALTQEDREALILEHRLSARKIARHMMKKWNAHLSPDELDSIVDLAICEAAQNYTPIEGVAFTTYLFYFLKGNLIKGICMNREAVAESRAEFDEERTLSGQASESEYSLDGRGHHEISSNEQEVATSPEKEAYLVELREHCNEAMMKLSNLERDIVFRVHVMDYNVTAVAKQLGYSRGHVSTLRGVALRKMKTALDHIKNAA